MQILRIVVFVVGAYFSNKSVSGTYFDPVCEFFLIGLTFGVVVITWHWSLTREFKWYSWTGFVLISTLIYLLVTILPELDIPETALSFVIQNPLFLGTILLPLAHKLVLKTSWLRVAITIPRVYAVSFSGGAFLDTLVLNGIVRDFVDIVFLWQGSYLVFMFYAFKSNKSVVIR